ncbi:toll/interleukin-1 receptor domain-containing protein [Priestia megaterium]|uniref:toll/interleukin-1 receptor domain-containing protein n=1 Tax=Priestia megaterium TaxID=1404 RepID=UPI00296E3469|nr:toll/interleukin-1 receptor domain-containing protein [Priestia megaterium]MDW4511790.1 toll/interleukin-1 receptor domain-containing protein [Priestia megaterium]
MKEKIDSIFISHAHRDKKYVKELVSLLTLMKVPNIICSSYPGYHIPNDVDIYEYLQEHLTGNSWVVFVLSDHYYDSAACLNEMGACWILNKKYTAILTPNFDFKEIKGAINPNQLSFKLNDLDRLYEFLDDSCKVFNLDQIHGPSLVDICKEAINSVNQIADDEKRNKNIVSGTIESIRPHPENSSEIQIGVRFINPEDHIIQITTLKFELIDENGMELNNTSHPHTKVYGKENKIVFYSVDISNSNYTPYFRKTENVDIRYSKDIW